MCIKININQTKRFSKNPIDKFEVYGTFFQTKFIKTRLFKNLHSNFKTPTKQFQLSYYYL